VEVNYTRQEAIIRSHYVVQVVRGAFPLKVECAPAFNYARDAHTTTFVDDDSSPFSRQKVLFESRSGTKLDLRYITESLLVRTVPSKPSPYSPNTVTRITFQLLKCTFIP
jgi:hypothetical protein